MKRADWNRACEVARRGGRHDATKANLVAAYRIMNERTVWPDDPFAE